MISIAWRMLACALAFQNSFDVVSVKPSDPATQAIYVSGDPPEHFRTKGTSVRDLIQMAYRVQDFEVVGGPEWITSSRYDIDAKSETGNGDDERRLRIQALLTDRFQLKTHRAVKKMPVYVLLPGKKGPLLKESKPTPAGQPSRGSRYNSGHFAAYEMPMSLLAGLLASELKRPVLDKTGLLGKYDVELTWNPDLLGSEVTGPSLFSALREQLGLELKSQQGTSEVLMIDSVERPSAN